MQRISESLEGNRGRPGDKHGESKARHVKASVSWQRQQVHTLYAFVSTPAPCAIRTSETSERKHSLPLKARVEAAHACEGCNMKLQRNLFMNRANKLSRSMNAAALSRRKRRRRKQLNIIELSTDQVSAVTGRNIVIFPSQPIGRPTHYSSI